MKKITSSIVLVNLGLLIAFYLVITFIAIPPSIFIIIAHVILLANHGLLIQLVTRHLKKEDHARFNIGYLSSTLLVQGRMGVFLVILGILYMFVVAFAWNPDRLFDVGLLSTTEGFQALMQGLLVLSMPIWGLLYLSRGERLRKQLYDLIYDRTTQIFREDPTAFPDFLKELYSRWQQQMLKGELLPTSDARSQSMLASDAELNTVRGTPSQDHLPLKSNGETNGDGPLNTSASTSENDEKHLERYLENFQDFLRQYFPSLWECYSHGNLRLSLNDLFLYLVERIFTDPKWIPYLKP